MLIPPRPSEKLREPAGAIAHSTGTSPVSPSSGQESLPPGFRFSIPIPVRFNETDASGRVNPISYFVYLSEARNRYFERLGIFDEPWNRPGRGTHYSVHLGCDYRGPLRAGQTIRACACATRLGRASVEMEFALVPDGRRRPVATGRTVCIHWDPRRGAVAPLPPRWRRAVEAFEGRALSDGSPAAPARAAAGESGQLFRFWLPISVRFAETDANGHLNDISYLLYFGVSRDAYFARLARRGAEEAPRFLDAHLSCDYRTPVRFGQTVQVAARMIRLDRARIECAFAVFAPGEAGPAATGRGVFVSCEPERGRPAPIPPDLRKAIAALERDPTLAGPGRRARQTRDASP